VGDLRGTIAQNYSTIDRLTDWIALGSTLTSTTGTAAVSAAEQAKALGKFAAADRYTFVANQGLLYNAHNEYTSNGVQRGVETTGVPFVRSPALVPYKTNFAGPGARATHHYRVGQFTIDQVINERFSAQVGYYHEDGAWKNYDVNAGTTALNSALRPDPNRYFRAPTVAANQLFSLDGFAFQTDATGTLNPNAGRPYFEANWRRRYSSLDSDTVRATVSGAFDLGPLFGRHRLAGLAQRLWKTNTFDSAVETFVGNPTGTVTSPTANSNRLVRRQYGTYGDSTSFAAPDWSVRPNVAMTVGGRTYVTDFVPDQDPQRSRRLVDSFILADQATFWNSRLVATAGYRIDQLRQDRTETRLDRSGVWAGTTGIPVLDPANVTTFKFSGHTRTLGLMYHVTKTLSVFVNTSQNIGLPDYTFRLGPDALVPPPPEGKGVEAGVQLNLFASRLFGRITYYDTQQLNVTNGMGVNNAFTPSYNFILDTVAPYFTAAQLAKYPDMRRSTAANADTVDSASRGVESRWVMNLSTRFRLLANYSYTSQAKENPYPRTYPLYRQLKQFIAELDAANPNAGGPGRGVSGLVSKNPSPPGTGNTVGDELAFRLQDLDDRSLDFTQASGARKHKASVTGVYSFTEGRLKGWSVGGGGRYQSAMLVGYKPSTGEQYYGNDSLLVDAMIRYALRVPILGSPRRLDLQVNARNVLDNQALQITRTTDIPTETLRWNFQSPRELVFSATLKF
jgi:iron complex outermembrane recepter protein